MAESTTQKVKVELIAGLTLGAVSAAIAAVWALVPNPWSWVTATWSSFISYLASPGSVPTWWLYILHIVFVAVVLLLLTACYQWLRGPEWIEYTEDNFSGAIWRWRYEQNSPVNAWAYCPRCDNELVYDNPNRYGPQTTVLNCDNCKTDVATFPGYKDDMISSIHRSVRRKIRSGEWKNYVGPKA